MLSAVVQAMCGIAPGYGGDAFGHAPDFACLLGAADRYATFLVPGLSVTYCGLCGVLVMNFHCLGT